MTTRARRALYGLVFGSSLGVFALFAGICGGITGVLVDIDHFPMVWGGQGSRTFHTSLAIVASIVAFYCLAHIGRLLYKDVSLRNRRG